MKPLLKQTEKFKELKNKFQSILIRVLIEIPIIGVFLIILNAWVLDDTSQYSTKIASPIEFLKKLFIPTAFSLFLTYSIFLLGNYFFGVYQTTIFIDLNLQIFSSLLGFGLAIFLIIFTLSSSSILKIMGSVDDAKLLCVQFSYPMVIWSMNLLLSAFLKYITSFTNINYSYYLGFIAIYMMIYSFVILFSIISSVFFTGMLKIEDDCK